MVLHLKIAYPMRLAPAILLLALLHVQTTVLSPGPQLYCHRSLIAAVPLNFRMKFLKTVQFRFSRKRTSYSLFHVFFFAFCLTSAFRLDSTCTTISSGFFLFCFSLCSVSHVWVFALEHNIPHSSREGGISARRFICFAIILLFVILF
jgi:hypothetical protein